MQAQEDLDGLLNVALEFAQEQLQRRGEFYPYAAAIGADGDPEMIAAHPEEVDTDPENPDSIAVIEACVAALRERREELRASAIVSDVLLDGEDAIRVQLEHAEGPTLAVVLPYVKRRLGRKVRYGNLRAQESEPRIWS